MAAVHKLTEIEVRPIEVDETSRQTINKLRFHASTCRASARLDFFAACSLIDPEMGEEFASQTLLRVLSQALEHVPVWKRPGASDFSFDELWLAKVIETCRLNDEDSFFFLTQRRVERQKQRLFRMLVKNLVQSSL